MTYFWGKVKTFFKIIFNASFIPQELKSTVSFANIWNLFRFF